MDHLLEDLLAYAESCGVGSVFQVETEMDGGAQVARTSSSASDKKMGGAVSDSNFGLVEKLDKLLMLASLQFEEQQSSTMEITLPHTRFAAPKTEKEILQMRQNAVPLTLNRTLCVSVEC